MAVRRLREQATPNGYSQEAFALRAAIARSYFSKIERGQVNLSLDLIERIAKTLGVPIARIFSEADKLN